MSSASPMVSVLTTCYNRAHLLPDTIESVLASTFRDFEYVIVDDCSTDGSFELANAYERKDSRVRVFRNDQNLGDYPNRNKAASYARGKYLKYVDSDNIIYPFGLDAMVDGVERFPEAGYGLLSESDPKRPYPVCVSPKQAYLDNFLGNFGYFGRAPDSSIIKKTAFDSIGGFTGKNLIGDLEMWLRLSQTFPVVKLPPYLGWDRVHEGQEKNIDPVEYQRMRSEIEYVYLTSANSPLSTQEVSRALRANLRHQRKQSLRLFASGHFRLACRLFALTFNQIR